MKLSRWLPGAALLSGTLSIFFGCRDIVAGDNVDLATELCELLVQCGDDVACVEISTPLTTYDPSQFLRNAEEVGCLDGCASARLCRDYAPVCTLAACDRDEQCCGFTAGEGVCGAHENCCKPSGVPCGTGGPLELPCCGSLGCNDGHCGDLVCEPLGAACEVGQQCCSTRCEDGVCSPNTCEGIGAPCVVTSDCCETDPPTSCREGLCASEDCVCDPSATTTCCAEGLACFSIGEELSVCAPPACPPPGAECGSNEDCAQGEGCGADLFCDFTFIPYCAVCLPLGAPCNNALEDAGCCEGSSCQEGVCQ